MRLSKEFGKFKDEIIFFITTKHTKIQTCGGQNVRRT